MNENNYTRIVDVLGRVVLPAELRNRLGIQDGAAVSVSLDEESGAIVIRPVK